MHARIDDNHHARRLSLSIAQYHVIKAFVAAGKFGAQIEALSLNQSPTYLLKADSATELASQPLTIRTRSASSFIAQEKNAQLAWQSVKEKSKVPACLAPVIQLDSPRVMMFEDFLSESECDFLIAAAQYQMQDSCVLDPTSGDFVFHAERTSRGTHFEHQSNQVVTDIENRIDNLFGFSKAQQEAMQILHYAVGGDINRIMIFSRLMIQVVRAQLGLQDNG